MLRAAEPHPRRWRWRPSLCAPCHRRRRHAARSSPASRDQVTPAQVQGGDRQLGIVRFPGPDGRRPHRPARRAAVAVPALLEAVASHADAYVRFRALVMLSGFNDPRTRDVMLKALGERNDRLRDGRVRLVRAPSRPGIVPRLLDGARPGGIRVRPARADARARRARRGRQGPAGDDRAGDAGPGSSSAPP